MRKIFEILCFILRTDKCDESVKKKKKKCTVYGEGTLRDQTCQKWFANFHYTPRSGRPVEVDSD